MTFDDIKSAIDAGHPILALTQAWSYENDQDYDIDEYSKSWGSGHYVAVIGYDQDNIIFMDPYNMGHYAFVPKSEWDRRWHDYDGWLANDLTTRCPGGTELDHLGLVIKRAAGPDFDVDAITKMY
jgi:predicted double-glycine peptidase